ncbi:ATP-binding protein [Bacillus sp. AK128]
MPIIYEAKVGSYLGLPILLQDGSLFGTLCAVDPEPYSFTEEEIEVMTSLSKILTNYLDRNHSMVQFSKEEELRQLEKLEQIGLMASGLAHEVGNPMQSIKGFIQYIFKDSNIDSTFQKIVMDEISRVEEVISEFVLSIQPSSPVKSTSSVTEIIKASLESIHNEAEQKEITVTNEIESNLPNINVEPLQIKKVLVNLLKNALEASNQNGHIKVHASVDEFYFIVIDVIDDGEGIPTSIVQKVGTPFFTTKDYGTGLGLSVSKNIIRSHGGTLSVVSDHSGTKVTVRVPAILEKIEL